MIYEFAATQDLHGYGKPWAPGAGKNKLENVAESKTENGITFTVNADGSVRATGTATSVTYLRLNNNLELPDGSYKLSGSIGGSSLTYDIYLAYKRNDQTVYVSCDTGVSGGTLIVDENTTEIPFVAIRIYNGATVDTTFYPMLIPTTETDFTTWAPYSNICPPEGFNIWDPTNQKYIQVYAGYVNANTRELYLRPVYQEYAGEELVGPWMSSLDPYDEDATPTEGAFVIDFGGELTEYEITPFMLQTLLDSLGIRQHFTDGAGLLNKLMDQAQGRVRSEEELLHLSRPLKVIAIGDQLPSGITFKPISKDVLPGLPGKFIR